MLSLTSYLPHMRYDDLHKDFGEAIAALIHEWMKENPDADLKELLAPLVRARREHAAQYADEARTMRTSAELWFEQHPGVSLEEFLETASLGSLINTWGRETGVDPRALLTGLGAHQRDERPTDQ